MIAGLEVPHVHLHVVPIDGMHDLDFANASDTSARRARRRRGRAARRAADAGATGVSE